MYRNFGNKIAQQRAVEDCELVNLKLVVQTCPCYCVKSSRGARQQGGGAGGWKPQNILAARIFDSLSSNTFTSIWQSAVLFPVTRIKYSIGSVQSSQEGALLGELGASLLSNWCFAVK